MLPYEQLDAFKVCHELTLRIHGVAERLGEGALTEMAYHIDMARALDLIPEETQREIEGLRGRAMF